MRKQQWMPVILSLLALAGDTAAQTIRARVVDAASRGPIAGAMAVLTTVAGDTVAGAAAGEDGFFFLPVRTPGAYRVTVASVGYRAEEREIRFAARDTVLPAFVLTSTAIALDPVDVRARSEKPEPEGIFGRSTFIVSGERMALLERQSNKVTTAIGEIPTLRMRHIQLYREPTTNRLYRNYLCIEGTRRMLQMPRRPGGPPPQCLPVVLVLDGIVIGDPHEIVRALSLADVESIEYVPPADAGTRYGLDASANGALVLSSRGRGPHRSQGRDGRDSPAGRATAPSFRFARRPAVQR